MLGIKRLFLALAFFALGLTIIGCAETEETDAVEVEENAISAKGMIVSRVDKELTRSFTGTIEGLKHASIYSKVSETVEGIFKDEGDRVKAGELIVRLDKTGAESRYNQVKSIYLNAEKNFKKMEFLYKEGAVSESEFDGAETQFMVAKADFEAASNLVELTSPISGIVTAIDVASGDFVAMGQKVGTVAQVDKLRIYFGVSDKDVRFFNVGDNVTASVEAGADISANGVVSAVAKSADPVTRTFQIEVELENKNNELFPGMFARTEIIVEKFDNILVVPRSAAVNRDNVDFLFVVVGDKVEMRQVELGYEFNGVAQVNSGLNEDDIVVVVGQNYLDDGYRVNLVSLTDINGKEIDQ